MSLLMIAVGTLLAAGVVAGLWSYFVSSVKNFIAYITEKFLDVLVRGFKALIKKVKSAMHEIVRLITHKDGKKILYERVYEVAEDYIEDEIPEEYIAMAEARQYSDSPLVDVTEPMELALEQAS